MIQNFSVVIPVYNESGNIAVLIKELLPVINDLGGGEIIFVDDASTDNTKDEIYKSSEKGKTVIKVVQHKFRTGQSAGLLTGIKHSQYDLIVTLDGDGQNNPLDIKKMFRTWKAHSNNELLLVIGNRLKRKDIWSRRFASRLAHRMRRMILRDTTPDSGCGLKVFSKKLFLSLPYFDHIHRFLPALTIRQGGEVISVAVSHRERVSGISKYSNFQRFRVGLIDLFGVSWLIRRSSFPVSLVKEDDAE